MKMIAWDLNVGSMDGFAPEIGWISEIFITFIGFSR